jgi:hypothetical protein
MLVMSALGQKRTLMRIQSKSALPPKADMRRSKATQDFGREVSGFDPVFFSVGLCWKKPSKIKI